MTRDEWLTVLCYALDVPDAVTNRESAALRRLADLAWPDANFDSREERSRATILEGVLKELPDLAAQGALDDLLMGWATVDHVAETLSGRILPKAATRASQAVRPALAAIVEWVKKHPYPVR